MILNASTKLRENQYKTVQEFADDVELVWSNCLLYNPPSDPISDWAHELKAEHEKLMKQLGIIGGGAGEEADGDYQDAAGEEEEADEMAVDDDGGDYDPVAAEDETPSRSRQRSSARLSAKGSRKYYEESDEDFEEGNGKEGSNQGDEGARDTQEDGEEEEEEEEEDKGPIVARIIAHRVKGEGEENGKSAEKEGEEGKGKAKAEANKGPVVKEDGVEYEYFVKWKETSYLHAEWVPTSRIEEEGTAGRGKIARYWKAKQEVITNKFEMEGAEDELFPPEYTIVDRIIAIETTIVRDESFVEDKKEGEEKAKKEASDGEEDTKDGVKKEEKLAVKEEQKQALAEAPVKPELLAAPVVPVKKEEPLAPMQTETIEEQAGQVNVMPQQPQLQLPMGELQATTTTTTTTATPAAPFGTPYTHLPAATPLRQNKWTWDSHTPSSPITAEQMGNGTRPAAPQQQQQPQLPHSPWQPSTVVTYNGT